MSAAKQIYFEPLGYVDQSQRELFDHPPDGYRFVVHETRGVTDRLLLSGWVLDRLYPPLDRACRAAQVPHLLLKAYLDSRRRRPPPGTALTYAYNHLVFRPEPWVCQVEFPTNLVGRDARILRRWKGTVERAFASPWCRGIIAWGEEGRTALLQSLDSRGFAHKIAIVPLAVRPREFTKQYSEANAVTVLFVGSGNRSGEFDIKGGKEAIEAFAVLAERYPQASFVVRSDMPERWKQRCRAIPRLRLIDQRIPWAALAREYERADIFVHAAIFPGYHVAPLDAMSHELAVVATDYGDCREKIRDGETGLLVPRSPDVADIGEGGLPARHTRRRAEVERAYRVTHHDIVAGLVERTGLLIEDRALRRRIGEAGQREIEHGALSIAERNRRLKGIFDHATVDRTGD